MSYYENQGSGQWPAPNNPPPPQSTGWDHQTPPARSGASSAIPREEPQAFTHQIEEVERAIDNLMKSGKMFNMGGRPGRAPGPLPAGPRSHSMAELGAGDARVHNPQSNLQNFYASQRHQSSRGSNEAESMMQAKRRMAAQRERDLRNYHQEQQYNRTAVPDAPGYAGKTSRTLSPGSAASGSGMTEEERRELIARQCSALYGEGAFAESGGYVDETGAARSGIPGSQAPPGAPSAPGPARLRSTSPHNYDFPRTHPDGTSNQPSDPSQRSRANSTSSPHSNAPSNKGVFENSQVAQQPNPTSNSSPDGSPPRQGGQGAPIGTKPNQAGATVAPIGTRPGAGSSTPHAMANPALNRRSSPLGSPLNRGPEDGTPSSAAGPSNPPSASADGPVGISGWGSRGGVWGNKSGLQASASVWG
ncbi:uncharacterized protein MKZ38_001210 [Zalerion maritima]|uniref:Uncharacterized protein n=1 Tax=Zalerion maritima TaxID=339359 RepID=A0AAD5RYX8_9PEZI|nr:uncharacterized protein MKZ38_001210 [Zalerion maritima]